MHIVQQISYHSAVQFSKFRDFCCSIDDRICMISEQQSDSSITCHPSSSFMLPFFLLGWKGLWWVLSCFFGIWCQKIASGLIRYNRDWKWSPKLGYGIWDWKPAMEVWSGDSWWQFLGFWTLLIWSWFSICQLLNCHEIFVPTWSLVPFATIFFWFFFSCQIWLYGGHSLWRVLSRVWISWSWSCENYSLNSDAPKMLKRKTWLFISLWWMGSMPDTMGSSNCCTIL